MDKTILDIPKMFQCYAQTISQRLSKTKRVNQVNNNPSNKKLMEAFVFDLMQMHEDLKKKRIECDKANDMRAGRIILEGELTALQCFNLANECYNKMED